MPVLSSKPPQDGSSEECLELSSCQCLAVGNSGSGIDTVKTKLTLLALTPLSTPQGVTKLGGKVRMPLISTYPHGKKKQVFYKFLKA